MKNTLLLFLICYVILFIVYFIIYYLYGLKKKSILKSMQVEYLKIKIEFNNKELNPKKIGLIICFIDPLIISLTGTIITLPKWNYVLELFFGFVILMALIYSFYEILGRVLKRKVDKK